MWLVLVPIAILSALWTGVRIRRRRATAGAAEDAPAADAPDSGAAPASRSPLEILAAAANLGCGGDARALSRRLAELPRPRLHPTLRDRDGLPVLAAFNADLDTGAAGAWLGAGSGPRRMADEHARALALLEPVALELFEAAARMLPALPEVEERVIAGLRRSVAPPPRESGSVHVTAMLPQDTSRTLREECEAWLLGLAADCGLDPRRSSFEVVAEQDAGDAWRRIGRLLGEAPDARADWQLLLAAGSWIGERGLHALAAGGRLARSGSPEGLVPGEGAVGLLLRSDATARAVGEQQAPVLAGLHAGAFDPGVSARRAARDSSELLAAAMEAGAVSRDDVAMVLSDADQRPSRSVEAAVAASAACPELDPAAAVCALGIASGHLGHVAPLALLAIAAERTRDAAAPVLALSVDSPSARTVALLRPAAAEALSEPSHTPANETGAAPGVAA